MRGMMRIAILCLVMFCLSRFGTAQDSKNLTPISKVLYQEFSEKGLEAAVAKYQALKEESAGQYDFSERQLNQLGYRLMSEQHYDAAITIFTLNTESFPNSPNAYDSLAEGYMRGGDTEKAIELYKKVLSMLSNSSLDSTFRSNLQKNAAGKLAALKKAQNRPPSTLISDFLSNTEAPFGKLHPDAPPETKQFGQLAGVWECVNHAYFQGQWFSGWPAVWVWKYVLDGFAVQDLWFQKEQDLPPPSASLGRDFAGTNLRIYDPALKKWRIAWFQNNPSATAPANAMVTFEAKFVDDQIIMTPIGNTGGTLRRIIFSDITEESFNWRTETSNDGGDTWTAQSKITGKKVRDLSGY